ncbi:uncharacterized protein K452DRAFT_226518 [Aplosporella prunicola CBS 121167]|uniref:MutL C-terminal dimerisation domain-containing protein n=1 Tax=Aplosporella prunicola CBS 121167 TaxID=1176127 RepID=A0A6A6BED5_9PEZI|nr:uncharacterized protein K452DRAFT_226518 [Aplosporella prunicola CBS 121167]KAF2142522.1 hypothetical protein K452DRAFT_226518 [Aplosporella prunicola CBS 121167]
MNLRRRDVTTAALPRPIEPLPPHVVAQIKSSTAITDLTAVVLGLLLNSLDAGAARIDVAIDTRRGGCVVEDDGSGILPAEFREAGGLGKPYSTSKHQSSLPVHGRNGTFLASLGASSLLTITSHHSLHRSHNTIVVHRSQVISRLLPAPHQQELALHDHGTRVTVRDLFGNMPVRVKQRAMMADDRGEAERQWDALKKIITGVLLAWRRPASVRLRDVQSNKNITLQTTRQEPSGTERIGKVKVHEELRPLLSIFSQASYITPNEWGSWVPASASTASIAVKGAISLEPGPTKTIQFISVGVKPIFPDRGHNEIFDEINRLFNASNFGTVDEEPELDEREKERRVEDKRFKIDGPTHRQLKGGRKGADRWPMFCLHATLKDNDEDALSSESKLHSIIEVLRAMITQWLLVHHFRPRSQRTRKGGSKPGSVSSDVSGSSMRASAGDTKSFVGHDKPALSTVEDNTEPGSQHAPLGVGQKRKRPSTSAAKAALGTAYNEPKIFSDWSRIRSANPSFYNNIWSSRKPGSAHGALPVEATKSERVSLAANSSNKGTELGRCSGLFRPDPILPGQLSSVKHSRDDSVRQPESSLDHQTNNVASVTHSLIQPSGDDTVKLTDTMSNETYLVNSRTGVVINRDGQKPNSSGLSTYGEPASISSVFDRPLSLSRRSKSAGNKGDSGSKWLDDFLAKWDNPIFRPSAAAIPQVSLQGISSESSGILSGRQGHYSHEAIKQAFTEASSLEGTKLSKDALKRASVVAQIDKKFILAIMDGSERTSAPSRHDEINAPKRMLVIIDQHAADERCRIEGLLAELCMPAAGQGRGYRSELGHASGIKTSVLADTLYFEISDREAQLFELYAATFADWGILFDIGQSGARKILIVKTLPGGISERCQADSKLLISLLRTEVWKLSGGGGARTSSSDASKTMTVADSASETSGRDWLRRVGKCPEGILEMLNSRACRSAVMFNDELTVAQCSELMERLATCAFPFQCAHGRPSMVPLVEVGGGVAGGEGLGVAEGCGGSSNTGGEGGSGFVEAFRRWGGGGVEQDKRPASRETREQ